MSSLPEQMTQPYTRDVLRISPEFIAELGKWDVMEPLHNELHTRLLRTEGTPWEYLGHLFRMGVQEAEQRSSGWEYAVMGNTVQLLVQLHRAIRDKKAKAPKAEKPELLDQVLLYLESRLAQKITLAEVARHFFVSESTIS